MVKIRDRDYSLMIDIDGTLCEQKSGWGERLGDSTEIDAVPLPYAKRALERLIRHFRIVIFSTRKKEIGERWLQKHEIPYDDYLEKPLNFLIIDDRCLQFEGDWTKTIKEIGRFKAWHKKDRPILDP